MRIIKKEYATLEEKKKDRRRGFWLWWGTNLALFVIGFAASIGLGALTSAGDAASSTMLGLASALLLLLPWVVNLGVLIWLAVTRSQMALGYLLGFASALAVVIVLGVILAVVCFAMLAAL